MLDNLAIEHADRIKFPVNKGKDYIIQRGKYTKMAYGMLDKNWMNAEDCVQEAFLKVLENPHTVHMSSECFEAYFTTVTKSVAINMKRNDHQREVHQANDAGKYLQYLEVESDEEHKEEVIALADINTDPSQTALATELLKVVTVWIDGLKPAHRQVVALSVLYGHTYKEVVSITGSSYSNVRKIIQRFRERMSEELLLWT